jgi:hypothetical protein
MPRKMLVMVSAVDTTLCRVMFPKLLLMALTPRMIETRFKSAWGILVIVRKDQMIFAGILTLTACDW